MAQSPDMILKPILKPIPTEVFDVLNQMLKANAQPGATTITIKH